MPARLKATGLIWPTLLAAAALAVLLGLGTWQMQRKAWKDDLQSQIDQRSKAAPVAARTAAVLTTLPEYTRVKAAGRFDHAAERYLYAPDPKLGPGYQVFTPLQLSDGLVLMVNRGFVPEALRDPSRRATGQIPGEVEVTGLLRVQAPPGQFTPANEPARNLWYWRDLPAMAGGGRRAVPASLDVEATPLPPGGWPKGGTTLVTLTNRHLEYAITWYGLALTLIGVYIAFARARLTAAPRPD
jgi:surfeit locus 1 family protein